MDTLGTLLHSPLAMTLAVLALVAAAALAGLRHREALRARASLELQAARYAAILASASDAVISADDRHRVVMMNPAAERLLGCTQAQALGEPVARFIPAAIRDRHAEHMAEFAGHAHQGSAMAGRDLRALRADGTEIEVEGSVSMVDEPGSGGARRLFTLVLRDVGERKAAERELHRVSERYRVMFEQSPSAMWLAENGRLQLVNAACVALLGARSADDLVGRPLGTFLPAEPAPGAWRRDEAGVPQPVELAVRRLDGSAAEVELTIAQVPNHGGTAMQGVMRDIAERKRREADLRNTQAALLDAQRIARMGYFEFDCRTRHWTNSAVLQQILGEPAGGAPLEYDEGFGHVDPADRARLRAHLETDVFAHQRPYEIEFRILRTDDKAVRWIHAAGRLECDAQGQPLRLFGSAQDITERKVATLALEQSREELRRLSASVTWAREAERRDVARELHDELGQRLSALKLDLAALRARAATACALTTVEPALSTLFAGVDGAIAATRRLASDLRPAMLDDLGLNAALDWLASSWRQRTGMAITLEADALDESLTEAAAITVFRIVQEALTNVSRHAEASRVRIALQRDDDHLSVLIEDNGRGLPPGAAESAQSSGLAGLRERARLLGGVATIGNRAEGGVRVEARLPLERVDSTPGTLGSP